MPDAPARYNIYALIHKALRLAMTDALGALGRVDAADPKEMSDAMVRLRDLLDFCELHLEAENAFVHPAMEARRPGSTARIAGEHVEHRAAIAQLRCRVEALARTGSDARAAAAFCLYGELAHFVGENFVHMHEEENAHNRVLWDAYDDDELVALENEIKAHHTPEQGRSTLRWMLPAMTPSERCRLVSAVRATAPAPVFTGVVALAQTYVDAGGWRKLEAALAA